MSSEGKAFESIRSISKSLKSRELSSEEITGLMLDRIRMHEPRLKSFVTVTEEAAIASARQADKEIADGRYRGPLHGIPLVLKDVISTKDVLTTHGMKVLFDNYPAIDSTVASRLSLAGAVSLGKTKMTEGAHGDHHPEVSVPVNPWNEALWCGTSSSGTGVSVAAGLGFGGIGSDTGGSVRFPSAANNLTGLKTTWGRVSRYGVYEMGASLDTVGPMGRSAEDVAYILQAIAGYDVNDPTSSLAPVPDYNEILDQGIEGLRIGLDHKWAIELTDAETQKVMIQAIENLKRLGAEIVDITFPDNGQAVRDWVPLCAVESAVAHKDFYPSRKNEFGEGLAGFIELGLKISGLEMQKIWLRRAALRGRVDAIFQNVDIIIAPVTGVAAPTVELMKTFGQDEQLYMDILRYTCPVNMVGCPSLSLPGGFTTSGAPVSFQMIGAPFTEDKLLQAAAALQRITDFHRCHPVL